LAAGVVLTGGTSKMEGVVELAEEIFHMPVRIGMPQGVKGLADIVRNPIYSTGVGLLLYGMRPQQHLERSHHPVSVKEPQITLMKRVKNWLKNNF
jgi:cell division protein FtsA